MISSSDEVNFEASPEIPMSLRARGRSPNPVVRSRATAIWVATGRAVSYECRRSACRGEPPTRVRVPSRAGISCEREGSPLRSADWQTGVFEWRVFGGDRQNGDHFEVNFQRLMDAPTGTFEIFRAS